MAFAKPTAVIVLAALALQAQAAHAQPQCFSEEEVSAAFVYAMPGVIDGVSNRCAASLGKGAFITRQGASMAARYAQQQDAAWPKARSALLKFVGNSAKGGNAGGALGMLSQIPGETMRPLVDALIVQEASGRIDPKNCGKVDKLAAALAPLDPADAGTLLGAMFAVIEPNHPSVCVAKS